LTPVVSARPHASALAQDLAVIGVLWRRDLLRFFREKTRVLGAVAQPAIFWAVIGSGMAGAFRVAGAEGMSYLEYFFPGVVVMVVLFAAVFSSMSVIEDRHQGFLQAVLGAPASRAAMVLGKSLGATTLALLQAALFLCLAPAAGFSFGAVDFLLVFAALVLVSLALTALGFAVAWWLDSSPAYHAFMGMLLIPLWILSGAMFPPPAEHAWVAAILRANPMSYAVDALRRGMYGGELPASAGIPGSAALDLAVLAAFAVLSLLLALVIVRRRA
jgi:daunorubicin resistance ABC transporter membrane protein